MGVNLKDLVSFKKIDFTDLSGKIIVLDAYNVLYQFLALIRTESGEPLRDSRGRITSHLNGLIFRLTRLIEYGIKPVLVFDGKPPVAKVKTLMKREEIKQKAEKEWKEALEKGDYEKAWSKAVQTSRFSKEMAEESKKLLSYMGIPWVQAPSEGEAQAAYMALKGDAWASSSRDYDSLLFGSPRLVRYLTISGKRFLRKQQAYYKLTPELIELKELLSKLGITREQLVDLAILVGTDYNEGVERIGPKTALKLIKNYGSIERIMEEKKIELKEDLEEIRKIFLEPEVTDDYDIKWGECDEENIIRFLCDERDFNRKRIELVINRLKRFHAETTQKTLDSWF